MCFHYYEYGDGCMGDAITCVKCGHSYYPSSCKLSILYLCGRIKNHKEVVVDKWEGILLLLLAIEIPIMLLTMLIAILKDNIK